MEMVCIPLKLKLGISCSWSLKIPAFKIISLHILVANKRTHPSSWSSHVFVSQQLDFMIRIRLKIKRLNAMENDPSNPLRFLLKIKLPTISFLIRLEEQSHSLACIWIFAFKIVLSDLTSFKNIVSLDVQMNLNF